MTRHELVALMPGAGPPAPPPACQLVLAHGHVAVLAPAHLPALLRRADALRDAAERARVLEALMPHGVVLPALPGQRLAPAEIADLVAANLPLLRDATQRLGGRVQFQVTVRWSEDAAAPVFGVDGADLPGLAARLRTRIRERLAATEAELLALPVAGDVLYNCALLIPCTAEAVLDAAIADIDSIWSDGFAIRVVGPFPAVTFASLVFERVGRSDVRAALADFGLPADFTEDMLRSARRRLLMSAAPDRRELLARQAELLQCLARLGRGRGPVHVGRIWSDGMSVASAGAACAA